MSKLDDRIQEIKNQYVGNTGVKVLLVEGTSDVDAYRIFLDKKFSGWENDWHLAYAGKKATVIEMALKEPSWLGLVDRDEWTDAEIAEHSVTCPNLVVSPRFCLESYLIDPAELWEALPAKQRAKVVGGEAQFCSEILADLRGWRRHAALWHGVRPLWRQLRKLGFPDSVLGSPPMPDDGALRAKFKDWHLTLDADAVLAGVHALEARLASDDVGKVCTQWLYAKSFYPEVVHPALDRLLGSKSAKERRLAIFRTLPVPADLEGLWQKMGLVP